MPVRFVQHRPLGSGSPAEARQRQDRQRGSARQRGYTGEWDRAAQAFLQDHPLCTGCRAMSQDVPAVLVDHVVPHRGDMQRFWDASGWQSSCRWHHDVVKQRLEALFDQGAIGEADLRLGSVIAIEVARAHPRG